MSISDSLGEQHEVELPQGTVRYRERGEGETIVFVHGLLVNGDLWRKVVPELAGAYRCIAPDLPLGSHRVPLRADADMSPAGVAQLIADFLVALDLRDVTLVGNDTGSGLTQIVATSHPERVARIVLTTGDAFSHFPPPVFKPIVKLGGLPGSMKMTSYLVKPRRVQRYILSALTKVVPSDEILDSYLGGGAIPGVRRDVTRFQRKMSGKYTVAAADKLPEFQGRALIVWAPDDRFFKNEHAYRLADLIPDSRVELIQDSFAFSSEDQPEKLAELIAEFMAEPRRAGGAKGSGAAAAKASRDRVGSTG